MTRDLDMYPALKSYFLSNTEGNPRFKRLKQQFADPMVELYHLILQAVLPTFTFPNKFLQREDPCIHAAHGQLNEFIRRLWASLFRLTRLRLEKLLTKSEILKEKVSN